MNTVQHRRALMALGLIGALTALGQPAAADTVSIRYGAENLLASFAFSGSGEQVFEFEVVAPGPLKLATVCAAPLPIGTTVRLDNAFSPHRANRHPKTGAASLLPLFIEKARGATDGNARVFTANYTVKPSDVRHTPRWRLALEAPSRVEGCTLSLEHGGIVRGFRTPDMVYLGHNNSDPTPGERVDGEARVALPARREEPRL